MSQFQSDRHFPRRWIGAAFGLAVAALAAGCAGVTSTEYGDYSAAYRVTELIHAGRNEGVPLMVIGNPFGMSDEEATAATAQQLRVPGWAPQVDFRPRVVGDGGYGVVLAFDPPRRTTPQQVCNAQFGRALDHAPEEGGDTRVVAAFCNGGALSSTRASFGGARSPEDPRYRELLSQLSVTLFPPYNPEMRDDGPPERIVGN